MITIDLNGIHKWEKQNLVTVTTSRDSYDIFFVSL